jgi:transposase-like protein
VTSYAVTCPACSSRGYRHTVVVVRRATTDDALVRRHCCRDCGHRWQTLQADPVNLPGGSVRWPKRGPVEVGQV